MKPIATVEDHKLSAAYESLRRALRAARFADRRDRPLAFWAVTGDRRLPMALLGYTINDLLSQSFEELSSTPGVGKKKFGSLITLLKRATRDSPPAMPELIDEPAAPKKAPKKGERPSKAQPSGFDPTVVSELLWEQWCDTVRRFDLQREPLGRLGPSLYKLPTVIWWTPLAEYLDLTLGKIRRLKTHGEKRVQAILEVFHGIHQTLGNVPPHGHLHVDVRLKFAVAIERWINAALRRSKPPTAADLKRHLLVPILEQLRVDAGPQIYRVVEERLGINAAPHAVQRQARRLGVTRARVYQLLETCGDIMTLRWPAGEDLFRRFYRKLASFPSAKAQVAQLQTLIELIYPKLDYKSVSKGQHREDAGSKRSEPDHSEAPRPRGALAQLQHRGKSNGSFKRSAAARK